MGRPRLYTVEEQKERVKVKMKLYYMANKEKYIITSKRYRQTEKGKVALERARQKERDNLSDNYIRQNLAVNLARIGYSLDRSSIPKEVIEISRQTILAKRQFKLLNQ